MLLGHATWSDWWGPPPGPRGARSEDDPSFGGDAKRVVELSHETHDHSPGFVPRPVITG